jgi:DNA primase
MTLHSLGINAVAVRSENTPVSENAFNLLKNRFDKIIVWFDADEAGIIGAHKLSTMYNLPVIYHNKELGKDPSEIYRNFGKEIILKIIKENENKKDENLTTVRNT